MPKHTLPGIMNGIRLAAAAIVLLQLSVHAFASPQNTAKLPRNAKSLQALKLPEAAKPPDTAKPASKPERTASLKNYQARMARVRVPFIMNEGQIGAKAVKYYAKTFGGTLFVTGDGELVYALPYRSSDKKAPRGWTLKESLAGDTRVTLQALDRSLTQVNYFKGPRRNWKTNVATYNILSLGEVYDGVHLKLKAYGSTVEKVFTVDADAVILVADAAEGLTPSDIDAADLVRRSMRPAVLAVNKADNPAREQAAGEFYPLGLGDPIPVSAYHGVGVADVSTRGPGRAKACRHRRAS